LFFYVGKLNKHNSFLDGTLPVVGSDSDGDLTQDDERSFQANLSLAAQTAHMPITKDTPSRRSSVLEGDEITRRFPDPGKFPSQNLINNYEPQNV
jgi:hypothetical protein